MPVLIVKDEKDMAQVLKVGLEEEIPGHVSLAFDGVSGLEVVRACYFDAKGRVSFTCFK
jgi:DNA-binding response OmpR family regulator